MIDLSWRAYQILIWICGTSIDNSCARFQVEPDGLHADLDPSTIGPNPPSAPLPDPDKVPAARLLRLQTILMPPRLTLLHAQAGIEDRGASGHI